MGGGYSTKMIPDMTGKVVIITGANTGIGRVCATEIARHGAHVICACRNKDKSFPVIESIKEETKNDNVEFMQLDLASIKSIIKFTNDFRKRELPIHVLLNNAGIMMVPYGLTEDGIERQFGTNHVGHFVLTTRLLDIVEESAPSRIVCLSSLAHKMSHKDGVYLNLEQINDEKKYSAVKWYGQSKLSNILFARALQKRINDKGVEVRVNAVHPGYVNTELVRDLGDTYNPIASVLAKISGSIVAKSPANGALTSLYVSTHPDIEENDYRGEYFTPTAKLDKTISQAKDEDLIEGLWSFTEELVSEKLKEYGLEDDTIEKKKKKGKKKKGKKHSHKKEYKEEEEEESSKKITDSSEEDADSGEKEKKRKKKKKEKKEKYSSEG